MYQNDLVIVIGYLFAFLINSTMNTSKLGNGGNPTMTSSPATVQPGMSPQPYPGLPGQVPASPEIPPPIQFPTASAAPAEKKKEEPGWLEMAGHFIWHCQKASLLYIPQLLGSIPEAIHKATHDENGNFSWGNTLKSVAFVAGAIALTIVCPEVALIAGAALALKTAGPALAKSFGDTLDGFKDHDLDKIDKGAEGLTKNGITVALSMTALGKAVPAVLAANVARTATAAVEAGEALTAAEATSSAANETLQNALQTAGHNAEHIEQLKNEVEVAEKAAETAKKLAERTQSAAEKAEKLQEQYAKKMADPHAKPENAKPPRGLGKIKAKVADKIPEPVATGYRRLTAPVKRGMITATEAGKLLFRPATWGHVKDGVSTLVENPTETLLDETGVITEKPPTVAEATPQAADGSTTSTTTGGTSSASAAPPKPTLI